MYNHPSHILQQFCISGSCLVTYLGARISRLCVCICIFCLCGDVLDVDCLLQIKSAVDIVSFRFLAVLSFH
jgi:hypothetical protein